MKVLVLNGSPKCEISNTMQLTRAFLKGADWLELAEIINVTKMDIKSCLGCFACWKKTPGQCVIKDSMEEILAKIIEADVVIWSFPLYYFGIPGALKNLIDRQLPLSQPFMDKGAENGGHLSRYDFTNQKHIVISTCGFWTTEGNYDAVISMFDHIAGKGDYSTIFCGQGELFCVAELKNRTDKYLELVEQSGKEFISGGIHEETQARLSEPLYPRQAFERMADASWGMAQDQDTSKQIDDSLSFTKQMAALYRPDGQERVLEFHYTDLGKTYQILLTELGSEVIEDGFKPYTTKIETPYSVWRSIARNEISGEDALFQRLYKVSGDFNLMLKWDGLFGSSTGEKLTRQRETKKANMMVFLLPWILIWTVLAIDPIIGAVLGITVSAFIPLLGLVFRLLIFEQISIPLITIFSLAALFAIDIKFIIPISYFSFGLIWFIGALMKIPLTAYYSASAYGGEKAFKNPLFIKTNRILTAVWGILYLLMPLWTYALMARDIAPYIGLVNSVITMLMGVFTLWFQKWYPAWYSRKEK